jgi:hypothetical protein
MIISALGWNDYMTKFSTQGWVQPRVCSRVEISTLLAEAGLKFQPRGWTQLKQGWNFNPGVELSPGLNILSCNRAFDFDRVLYYRQGWNFNPVNRAQFNPGVENAPCNRPLTANSPLQSATLLSQHYHYLRWPNLHVRHSVTFYIIFLYKVYIGFLSCICDWTVAVAQDNKFAS